MAARLLRLLLLLLCAPLAPAGYSFKRDSVLAAGQKTFEDVVVYSKQLTVVVFYSPACPHCTRLEPAVKDAAKRLAAEGVKVVAVDGVAERGLADYYNVTGYPFVYIFVPPEKATSHAGGEAEPVGVTGIGSEGRIVQAACEQKQLLVERALRNRPAGGSKILPELESYDDVRAVVTLDHHATLSAKAAVLYLAGGGGDSSTSVCGLHSAETAPDWLTSVATKFKEGRAKAVSFGAVPASLVTAGLAEDFGLTPDELPALLFVRAKVRRGRPAGVSCFGGSLNIDAKQKKTALIKAARLFVEKAVRGDLPDSASPRSLPSSLQPAPGSESEDREADEAQLQREKVAAWVPTEIDSSDTLRSSCYDSAGVCLMLLCSNGSGGSSTGVAAAAVCHGAQSAWADFGRRHRAEKVTFVTLDVARTTGVVAARAAEAVASSSEPNTSPTALDQQIQLAEAAASGGVRQFVRQFLGASSEPVGAADSDDGGIHLLAIKNGKRPRFSDLTAAVGGSTSATKAATEAAIGAWQRAVLSQFYLAHGIKKTKDELESIWTKRAATTTLESSLLAPMSTAQFSVVCDALAAKYPSDASPVKLWRQTDSSAPIEDIDLLEASAAAAASVSAMWSAEFEAQLETLLGGNAKFSALKQALPTLDALSVDPPPAAAAQDGKEL